MCQTGLHFSQPEEGLTYKPEAMTRIKVNRDLSRHHASQRWAAPAYRPAPKRGTSCRRPACKAGAPARKPVACWTRNAKQTRGSTWAPPGQCVAGRKAMRPVRQRSYHDAEQSTGNVRSTLSARSASTRPLSPQRQSVRFPLEALSRAKKVPQLQASKSQEHRRRHEQDPERRERRRKKNGLRGESSVGGRNCRRCSGLALKVCGGACLRPASP